MRIPFTSVNENFFSAETREKTPKFSVDSKLNYIAGWLMRSLVSMMTTLHIFQCYRASSVCMVLCIIYLMYYMLQYVIYPPIYTSRRCHKETLLLISSDPTTQCRH